eukprot:gb/GFBE01045585.1/.p1 GENE.gb/GFBE01045585.1/~~gb/GFBE01045585.1/.p1  ORF type:complete len:263 (+),score=33.24 gb/GFBE01045585.1/:1-789(+)
MAYEHWVFPCWLLKDASWVVLFPYAAWPAIAASLTLESLNYFHRWRSRTWTQRSHHLVTLLWMLGNGTWMTEEFLYEERAAGAGFPWFHGPFVQQSDGVDGRLLATATQLFSLAFALYIMTQVAGRLDKDADARTIQELDEESWIGPWVLKDFCWIHGWLGAGLLSSAAVALVMVVAVRDRSVLFPELLWLAGNTLWLIDELYLKDAARWARIVTFVILGSALSMEVKSITDGQRSAKETSPFAGEKGPDHFAASCAQDSRR